jgi:hypothetical protein
MWLLTVYFLYITTSLFNKGNEEKNHVSMVTMVTPRYLHATNMIQMKSSTDSLSE